MRARDGVFVREYVLICELMCVFMLSNTYNLLNGKLFSCLSYCRSIMSA